MLASMRRHPILPLLLVASAQFGPTAQAQGIYHPPSIPGGMTRYYAPNNQSVQWNGNKATIVVFNFSRVRQGEVWLSQAGVDGKSVLSCPHNGYLFACMLYKAMHSADYMATKHKAQSPPPRLCGSIPMGEHVAEFYSELVGETPVVRIDFGRQASSERRTYRFNLPANYQLMHLLAIMCHSLHGPNHRYQSASIHHLLKKFAKYNPHPNHPKKKKPNPAKKPDPWLN